MPIDPQSGLYQEPEGSMFPNGVFGGALSIGNNQIARDLANEAANRRAMQDHMSELMIEDKENELTDDVEKRRRLDDEFNRGEQFREWINQHPQATTTEKLNAALQYGQRDVKSLTDLVQSEQTDAFKKAKLAAETNVDYVGEARKEATEYLAQGLSGKDTAELLRSKFGDKVPSVYYDKLAMVKGSPLTEATINQRNSAASVNKARVAGTLPPLPGSGQKVDPATKLNREKQRLLAIQQSAEKAIANQEGKFSDQEIEVAKIRANTAKMQIEKIDNELADLNGRAAGRTPPPIEDSVQVQPPKFKPIPAPGKEPGKTGTVKKKDGTLVTAVVKMIDGQPFWVPNN